MENKNLEKAKNGKNEEKNGENSMNLVHHVGDIGININVKTFESTYET